MQVNPESTTFCSNHLARILLLSLDEIIGRSGVNAMLNSAGLTFLIGSTPDANEGSAFPARNVSRMMEALEVVYGVRAGRGLAQRAGAVGFRHILRASGEELGLTSMEFRLAPLPQKMIFVLTALSDFFAQHAAMLLALSEQEGRFLLQMDGCVFCFQRKADTPVCHWLVGLLQEAFYWLSGGKYFNVVEIDCTAMGDAQDVILIDKQSLD